ncbi:MAG: cytochrome c oxidase subunit II [Chloroflexi bacterium]|nr:cytochrome c oxidase subunit II [Chloroflexota bacterium]
MTRRRVLKKDFVFTGLLWALLALVLEVVIIPWDPFPLAASEEAAVVDDAFKLLMVLGAPVFALVVATVAYSFVRFRRRGDPAEDGPPMHGSRGVVGAWLAVTTALTLLVIVTPGITGLRELRASASEPPDLLVEVQGGRWFWKATYPEYGVTSTRELVLPKDELVRFEVTALDVLHSFWIPAFRIKIDAVPGRTTITYATPDTLGSYDDDESLRVQCAELCGVGHSVMRLPVRVVTAEEFRAWVAERATK